MRDDVGNAIEDAFKDVYFHCGRPRKAFDRATDDAIAAATPHIRRQVIEELIVNAQLLPPWPTEGDQTEYFGEIGRVREFRTFADWLRSKLEAE